MLYGPGWVALSGRSAKKEKFCARTLLAIYCNSHRIYSGEAREGEINPEKPFSDEMANGFHVMGGAMLFKKKGLG
ncbi:MAG: hypothetical protein OEZ57_03710 [Nitrospirota bacterium]|nr:hypothetical protein [Nitrospirota bacterium]MDH5587874.1 hypothetical protein [Nitrospirota bacterium]MDH5774006.1 hypothetical protein [Nitrospirota bacterium]